MFSFLQDLSNTSEKVERLNQLEDSVNSFYILYRHLTSHPWIIIIPLVLSVLFTALAWYLAGRYLKKDLKQRFFWRYILSHVIYIPIVILFTLVWGALIQHISAFWSVGLVFYGLQVAMPLFLIIVALLAGYSKFKSSSIADFKSMHIGLKIAGFMLSVSILSVSFYAFFIEPFDIEVTQHHFEFPDKDLNLKIVHLTDIQTDYLSSREKKVVEIVNAQNPDIIVITGDYFNGGKNTHPWGFESARYVLENIHAKYGIFATSSDSNRYIDHEPLFEGLPIDFMENKSKKLTIDGKDLYIVGVSRRYPNSEAAWQNVPAESNTLLVYHGPEIFFSQEDMDHHPNLILVGHTHGGQIGLPFIGPLTSATRFGRELAKGWFETKFTKMYVNRGIGMEGWWAPKIRFLTRPEIAVIEIGAP